MFGNIWRKWNERECFYFHCPRKGNKWKYISVGQNYPHLIVVNIIVKEDFVFPKYNNESLCTCIYIYILVIERIKASLVLKWTSVFVWHGFFTLPFIFSVFENTLYICLFIHPFNSNLSSINNTSYHCIFLPSLTVIYLRSMFVYRRIGLWKFLSSICLISLSLLHHGKTYKLTWFYLSLSLY